MTIKRGEIWLADLNPIHGSEQAGTRPVLIFQNDLYKIGTVSQQTITAVEGCVLFTMGIT